MKRLSTLLLLLLLPISTKAFSIRVFIRYLRRILSRATNNPRNDCNDDKSCDGSQKLCPEVSGQTDCALVQDPVLCVNDSGSKCEYSNQCEASAAGLAEEKCKPKPCPVAPLDRPPCLAKYDPVICPPSCEYSNSCEANIAGWDTNKCSPKPCPVGPEDKIGECPPDVFDPYVCPGGCEYNQECEALAAGFKPGECLAKEKKQLPASEQSEQPPVTEQSEQQPNSNIPTTCPVVLETEDCPDDDRDPYLCYFDCEYANSCQVLSAGIDIDTYCRSTTTENCRTEWVEDLFCFDLYDPVVCIGGCEYSNACYAQAVGFNETTECRSKEMRRRNLLRSQEG